MWHLLFVRHCVRNGEPGIRRVYEVETAHSDKATKHETRKGQIIKLERKKSGIVGR